MQKRYAHLRDVIITHQDLPVNVISGAGDYTSIKSQERERVGQPGELIAKLTMLEKVVIFPGLDSGFTITKIDVV